MLNEQWYLYRTQDIEWGYNKNVKKQEVITKMKKLEKDAGLQ